MMYYTNKYSVSLFISVGQCPNPPFEEYLFGFLLITTTFLTTLLYDIVTIFYRTSYISLRTNSLSKYSAGRRLIYMLRFCLSTNALMLIITPQQYLIFYIVLLVTKDGYSYHLSGLHPT